ncbi:unnamed protein product [Durusdinium trenchii]|uniref:Uncharacterized protein n=1 Tax=Durusdinium trenchii TaxID=1381693 RepID=A0ABP0JG27_9DINO
MAKADASEAILVAAQGAEVDKRESLQVILARLDASKSQTLLSGQWLEEPCQMASDGFTHCRIARFLAGKDGEVPAGPASCSPEALRSRQIEGELLPDFRSLAASRLGFLGAAESDHARTQLEPICDVLCAVDHGALSAFTW